MTASHFIDAIKVAVHDSAISGVEQTLLIPSGRKPPANITEVAHWFSTLNNEERNHIHKIVAMSVHAGVFGMLAVLDGVRSIQDNEERGQLLLTISDGTETQLINDPSEEMLHDIYQSKVYDDIFKNRG